MSRSPGGRALAAAIEPIVGSVYFANEAHDAFAALGHGPTTGQVTDEWGKAHWGRVLMTDYHAYFCGRGSILGQVPGEVIAAAFGVFRPDVVAQAAANGWPIADAAAMRAARDRGAVAQLRRILGERPDGLDRASELLERAGSRLRVAGRPMYAGVLAQGLPDEPMLRPVAAGRAAARVPRRRVRARLPAPRLRRLRDPGVDRAAGRVPAQDLQRDPGLERRRAERGGRPAGRTGPAHRGRRADRGRAGRPGGGGGNRRQVLPAHRGRAGRRPARAGRHPAALAIGDDYDELIGQLEEWAGAIVAAGYYPSDIRQLPPQWGQLPDRD